MNVDMEDNRARLPRYFTLEMLMSMMVALSGLVLIWNLVSPVVSVLALFIAGTASDAGADRSFKRFGGCGEVVIAHGPLPSLACVQNRVRSTFVMLYPVHARARQSARLHTGTS